MLVRAIYVSDAVGTAGASALSMAEILGVAIRNNRPRHVTGALLYHEGCFLQAIEGARADVDRLLRQLGQDRRHERLRLRSHAPVGARRFEGRAMAQCRLTPGLLGLIGPAGLGALDPRTAEAVLAAAAVPLDATG